MFPDLSFPVVNDSDSFRITKEHNLYELAYARYGQPNYGAGRGKAELRGLQSVLWGPDELTTESFKNAADLNKSRDFPGVGGLMLRQGQGADQICVHMHYGPHGGAHGHPDKLGIIAYARGQLIAPDPGRVAYASPLHASWYKTTLAHNTIIADGKNQQPTQARLVSFEEKDGLSCAQAECSTAYPGINLVRTLAISPRYILDVMTAESETSHTYDLAWHIQGEAKPDFEAPPGEFARQEQRISALEEREHGANSQTWSVDYAQGKTGGTRLTMPAARRLRFFSHRVSPGILPIHAPSLSPGGPAIQRAILP